MVNKRSYDFSGWATRNDLKCSDGRTIRKDAFKDNDGQIVPLVWNHRHDDPLNILGHALLENRPEGVYTYCKFNDTESGKNAKLLVNHGDIVGLSIYANKLKQDGGNVLHGAIREVSLVLAGANPGAFIDSVISHGEESEDEAVIYSGSEISLFHSDKEDDVVEEKEELEHVDSSEEVEENTGDNDMAEEKTVKDVFDEFTDEQKQVVYFMIGQALKDAGVDIEGGEGEPEDNEDMKHNVFDTTYNDENTLSHSEMMTIITDAKRYGSMKDSFLNHAEEYGIENIDWLFPEAKTLNNPPEFIKRKDDWVAKVMGKVHHTPFSRIKSVFADITEDDARAKGYIKGKLKKEEVFGLLKRVTEPTTVYKKQKMDRDDVIDITDFDVIAWLKGEMRTMLDEEIARAILFGDGRSVASEDKIDENHIRPVVSDSSLFTIEKVVTEVQDEDYAKTFINESIKARKDYRGSGSVDLYIGEDMITDMLLLEDGIGHKIYKTENELATALRVKEIVHVPDEIVPEGIIGVYVDLGDYNVGADKGGSINMFDDFDIDYNQMKYLIETRCSGALVKPYSAIVMKTA